MTTTLLETKLNIPALRPSLVLRPHLIDKLRTGLPGKLTLVSAPPGFGKTTLISSWLQQCERPSAWLSLSKADNGINRFLTYLSAALQKIDGQIGETTMALLQSGRPPPAETLLTLLVNDLATFPQQAILVLDDYHVIEDLDVHRALAFLLDHLPPQLHLTVISREDPPLPLHRLRSRAEMTGIYVHDLRFSAEEASRFLQESMSIQLEPNDIALLTRRTEGWVAGLQLAALSLQDLQDPSKFVSDFAGDDRYIADYLLNEVFERQPASIQVFLLQTAVLDRFCPAVCATVTGLSGQQARTMLAEIEEANLFIIPLDNKREWYRYHHLFSDFLRIRLREETDYRPEELHRRASLGFEGLALLAEAIEHALEAGDYDRAAAMAERIAPETIFGQAQWATLFDWLKALPAELIQARPRLNLQYAWALFTTGHWATARNLLEALKASLDAARRTPETERLLGELATVAALVAYSHGEMDRASERAREALHLLPADNLTLRCVARLALGEAAMAREDAPAARESLQAAVDMAVKGGSKAIALFALGDLARLELTEGYLRRAAEHYRRARPLGTIRGSTLLGPTGIACIQMGEVLREWNDLEKAELMLREGVALCRELTGLPNIVFEGLVNLARVLLASGEEQEAAKRMEEAENLLTELLEHGGGVDPRPMISVALSARLRYYLAQDNVDEVARWLDNYGISAEADVVASNLAYYPLLTRVLIDEGRLEDARRQLRRLGQMAAERESPRRSIEVVLLKSLLCQAEGDQGGAESSVFRALQLAQAEGYLRLFVDQGKAIRPLLRRLADRPSAPSNLKAVLSLLGASERQTAKEVGGAGRSAEPSALVEPLKEQELRILRLMAAGCSNREIAAELYLSVNTIKVYASRIYNKLGVHRRGAAAARARELGLI